MPLIKSFDTNDARIVTADYLAEHYQPPTKTRGMSDKDFEELCKSDRLRATGLLGAQANVAFKEQLVAAIMQTMEESRWVHLYRINDYPTLSGKFDYVLECMEADRVLDSGTRSYLFRMMCVIAPKLEERGYSISKIAASEMVTPEGALTLSERTRLAVESLNELTKKNGKDVSDEVIEVIANGLNNKEEPRAMAAKLAELGVQLSRRFKDAEFVLDAMAWVVEKGRMIEAPGNSVILSIDIPAEFSERHEEFLEGLQEFITGKIESMKKFPVNNGTREKAWCSLNVRAVEPAWAK